MPCWVWLAESRGLRQTRYTMWGPTELDILTLLHPSNMYSLAEWSIVHSCRGGSGQGHTAFLSRERQARAWQAEGFAGRLPSLGHTHTYLALNPLMHDTYKADA